MPENSEIKLLLTRQDVARLLSVSVRTVDTLLASKALASRRIGRRRLIPRIALDQFTRRDHTTTIKESDG